MKDKETPKKRRLFVGTFLPNTARESLGELQQHDAELSKLWHRRIRWVAPQKYHLTWLFIGHVEAECVEEIEELLVPVAERHKKTQLSYARSIFWPSQKNPHHWVLVPESVPDEVISLAADVRETLKEYLQKDEKRSYKPHITLARFDHGPSGRIEIPQWLPLPEKLPMVHKINQIDLIESHLGKGQHAYVSLRTYKLC